MYKYNIEIQLLAIQVWVYPYTVVVEGKKINLHKSALWNMA